MGSLILKGEAKLRQLQKTHRLIPVGVDRILQAEIHFTIIMLEQCTQQTLKQKMQILLFNLEQRRRLVDREK
jgi:hypothetical protein